MRTDRRRMIWRLAPLLAICATACFAQEGDCVAQLKITRLGAPRVTETPQSMMRTVGLFHYRVDARSEEKQCVNVTFDILVRYLDKDGKPGVRTNPTSIRLRNGQGSEYGEIAGSRSDSRAEGAIENVSCKRC
jgi:hypothetical protein